MEHEFVHLHLHTEYSLLDGVGKIDEYIDRAKELNMSALAVTDHGNMFCQLEFYQKALKAGIKPIVGIETYISSGDATEKKGEIFHLVLLAKNEIGYKNLVKLSSYGYVHGYYYKPRIDKKILRKHSKGLIGLSACLKGEVPFYILKDNLKQAKESLNEYIDIFGKEDFYLEIQNNGVKEQRGLNIELSKLAKENEIRLVATNDVHYVYRGDDILQDILFCVQTGSKIADPNRMKIDTPEIYLKSREEMLQAFKDYPEAVDETNNIAKKCNLILEMGSFKFPEYNYPEAEESIESFLKTLVNKGVQEKFGENPSQEVLDRVHYELGIINKMGYPAYFVVVWDFINYAKSQNIPVGPGRGSAAGSMVAYLLDITELNPMKYGLIFERFLNPQRVSMPDIDIDICQERRQEVIDYVTDKYGEARVAQIITFGRMKARGAIRDVGRVLDITLSKIDKAAKLIPFGMNIESALKEVGELRKIYEEDPEIQKVLDYSKRIEGKIRHASIHAAGIVISKDPLDEIVPIYKDNKISSTATQYQMKELEEIGLLKMDFLGLRNLTIIKRTLDYIKSVRGLNIDLHSISKDDEKTYELLKKGDTLGVFQLESTGIRKYLRQLSPDKFEDVIAILALYRPGPLGSGMVENFINAKHGRIEISYPHNSLKDVLKETYGVILYQEQVMKIANIMADYTLGEADLLRRAMGKKVFEIMEENRSRFVERAVKKRIKREKAEEVFDLIDKFAGYGFNKSHSAAYALVAYWTAYFKANYPKEFYAALMTSERNNIEKLAIYIEDARSRNIEVSSPDINYSFSKFKAEKDGIRFGLSAVKNIGEGIVEKLLDERMKNGLFKDYEDFVYRMKKDGINKKALESFILSGCLDEMSGTRRAKYEEIENVLKKVGKRIEQENNLQLALFGGEQYSEKFTLPELSEYPKDDLLRQEKEYIGLYFSGHPLDKYKAKLKIYSITPIHEIMTSKEINSARVVGVVRDLEKKVTKKGTVMAIFKLEDYTDSITVLVFSKAFNEYSNYLLENKVLIIDGKITIDSFNDVEEKKLIGNKIRDFETIDEEYRYKVYLLFMEKDKYKSEEVKKVIRNHPGESEIYIAVKELDGKKEIIKLNKKFNVDPSDLFIQEITEILGEDRVRIK